MMACFFLNLIPAWEFIVSGDGVRHTDRREESLSAVDSCNDMDEACARWPPFAATEAMLCPELELCFSWHPSRRASYLSQAPRRALSFPRRVSRCQAESWAATFCGDASSIYTTATPEHLRIQLLRLAS
jgi:hypothetical protein